MMTIQSFQEQGYQWVYRITISEPEISDRDKKFYAHSIADLLLGVEHYFKGSHTPTRIKSCPLCKELRK